MILKTIKHGSATIHIDNASCANTTEEEAQKYFECFARIVTEAAAKDVQSGCAGVCAGSERNDTDGGIV